MSNISQKLESLSAKKKALLELKLKQLKEQKKRKKKKAKVESPKIVRRPVTGPMPLSLDQERLWFINQFAPDNAAYNIHTATRFVGPLDVGVLEKSLNEVIKRHNVLRSSFVAENGHPKLVVAPTLSVQIPVIDIQHLPRAEQEAKAKWYAEEEAQQGFDMTTAPLLHVFLLKMSPTEHVLYFNQHHTITDWWSAQLLFQEWGTIYEALLIGQPLAGLLPEPYQYTDFVLWERERIEKGDMERSLAYWRKHLAGGTFKLDLPIAKRRPPEQTFVGRRQWVTIPPALGEALKAFSRHENVTLFMTCTAAFNALLFRYTGQTDITLGTPLANRSHVELENVLGFLITMLMVHTDFSQGDAAPRLRGEQSEDISFKELVHKVRQVILEAYANQDVPFAKLLEIVQPARDWSRNPVFQFSFIFLDEAGRPEGGGFKSLESSGLYYDPHVSRLDMTLIVEDHGDQIISYIEYNSDLFDEESMARFAEHLRTLMESMVAAPDTPIAELPMVTEAERQQVLFEWNETALEHPEKCLHHLFEEQVLRTPEAPAVVFVSAGEDSHEMLTYAELNARANQLAHHLQRLGVGAETLVGVCVERSIEMVVGLLGILKAGGAYVPLDPRYPKERLAFMLSDMQASFLLTQEHLIESLPKHNATVICLDREWADISTQSTRNPESRVSPHNLAYMIYTSGSTGQPKGVLIEHKGTGNLAQAQIEAFQVQSGSRVLQFASFSFDAAISEIIMALLAGATLVMASQDDLMPGPGLIRLLQEEKITTVTLPPSVLASLPDAEFPELKTVISAGEACSAEIVTRWAKGRRFFNAYGPAEATVCATIGTCTVEEYEDTDRTPSIGRPISNVQIYLLDANEQPVPIGLPGELYIGSVGLARGYHRRPNLTRERFVANPFNSPRPVGAPKGHDKGLGVERRVARERAGMPVRDRLYKTGDLARWLPDGNLEFLGRIDHQVKIRGFRIELGEIESGLRQHPTVQEAVVIARQNQLGEKQLMAYVVPTVPSDASAFIPELRPHLKKRLPDYMVPAAFVILDGLPLTPNGKVNRQALPAPDRTHAQETDQPPSTPTEKKLAVIWMEILGLERVGRHDDFFMLGGHSLLATKVILEVGHALEIELPLRQLLSNPTVAELAEWIDRTRQTLAGLQDMTDIGDDDEDEREEFVL